ncbi:hypothetical protein NM688_g960 [Phlebia brevispora]|uniref:Uncharacterized protein n=1 Tax=Phlebia brevispora TaxID=194682 RepID=A0ACC1TD19_9APHY|nr:hypothetical protein NM688_g960 [Phlebia brevispora]
MAPIRVGFIGLSTKGWAASALAGPLFDPLLSDSYTLTALCTTNEASAKAAAAHYTPLAGHEVRSYHGEEGIKAIANDPEVDLVAISIKMPDHYKAVMPAIEAGKDIFVEWTVGNGYKETLEIAEAAKRKGVRVLVGAQSIQHASLKKVKELVDSGKIGRVISTTALLAAPTDPEFLYWGRKASASTAYGFDIDNGASVLTVPVGHFLSALTYILGDFTEISASGAIQQPYAELVDAEGNPTGQTIKKTVHDQIALSGVLQSKDGQPGTFVNIHCRAALPLTGEHGRGRTSLKWIIDGELGTVEVQNKPEDGSWGAFITTTEKRVLLNGEEVKWEAIDADRLGSPGKAWLEFAKGKDGKYWGLEESVRVHRVLDAALTSIQEGKRISLVSSYWKLDSKPEDTRLIARNAIARTDSRSLRSPSERPANARKRSKQSVKRQACLHEPPFTFGQELYNTLEENRGWSGNPGDGGELRRKEGPFKKCHTGLKQSTDGLMLSKHDRASVHVYIREDLKDSQHVNFDVFVEAVFGRTPEQIAEWTSIIAQDGWLNDEEVTTNLKAFCAATVESDRYEPLCNIINRVMQMAHGRLPGVPDTYPIDDICVEKNDPLYIIPTKAQGKLAASRKPDLVTLRERHAVHLRPPVADPPDDDPAADKPSAVAPTPTSPLPTTIASSATATASLPAAAPAATGRPRKARTTKGRVPRARAGPKTVAASAKGMISDQGAVTADDTHPTPVSGYSSGSVEAPSAENAAETTSKTSVRTNKSPKTKTPRGVHWYNVIMNWELKGSASLSALYTSLSKDRKDRPPTNPLGESSDQQFDRSSTASGESHASNAEEVSCGKKRRRQDDDDLMRCIRQDSEIPANISTLQSEDRFPYILKDASIQTGSYALETLAGTFGTRLFCVNVLAKLDRLYFWYYDACGFVYTESISLLDDFEKAAAVMIAIACSTPQQLGALPDVIQPSTLAPYPENWPPENLNGYTLTMSQPVTVSESKSPATTLTSDAQPTRDVQVTLQESVFSQYVLAGRRTFVYTVKTEPPISKNEHIIKVSYQVNTRRKEYELLKKAREARVGHLPTAHASADLWKMSDGVRAVFLDKGKVTYDDRTLRAIVYDRYMPLESLIPTSPESIPLMAYQLLDCLHDLRYKANILHRDIAVNNVMYEYRQGRLNFILIDFDMATEVSNDPNAEYTPSSKFRTGTLAFMAMELIQDAFRLRRNKNHKPIAHRFCHDVESIFWLTIWVTFIFVYTSDEVLQQMNHEEVQKWETSDLKTAGNHKKAFLADRLTPAELPDGAVKVGLYLWFDAWWDVFGECHTAKLRYQKEVIAYEMGLGPEPVFDLDTVDGIMTRDHLMKVLSAIIPDPYASSSLDAAAATKPAAERQKKGVMLKGAQKSSKPGVSTKEVKKKRGAPATKKGRTIEQKETKRPAKIPLVERADDDENDIRKRLRPRKLVAYK